MARDQSSEYSLWLDACSAAGFGAPVTVLRPRSAAGANDPGTLLVAVEDVVDVYMLPADAASPGRPEPTALERLKSEHPGCRFVHD